MLVVNGARSAAIGRGFRRAALPLACYYAITLGLPLLNGAGSAGTAFMHHAVAVFVVPMVLIALVSATRHLYRSAPWRSPARSTVQVDSVTVE